MIIVATPADWRKTRGAVHGYGRISVADFEMDARYSIVSRTFQEIAEQSAPETMQAWSKAAGVSSGRLLLDPTRYGSLLAAAPLTALHDAIQEGRLQNGMTALLLACGRGPAWAAACLRWGGGGLLEW